MKTEQQYMNHRVMPESAAAGAAAKPPALSRGSTAGSFFGAIGVGGGGGRDNKKSLKSDRGGQPDASALDIANPMADYTTAPAGPRVNGGANHPLNWKSGAQENGGAAAGHRQSAQHQQQQRGGGRQLQHAQWDPPSPAGRKDPPRQHHAPHHHSAAPTESALHSGKYHHRGQPHPQPIPAGRGGQQQQLRGLTLTEAGGIELPIDSLDGRHGSGGTYGETSQYGTGTLDTLGGVETIGTKDTLESKDDGKGGGGGGGWKPALPWNVRKDKMRYQQRDQEEERRMQHPYHTTTPSGAPGGAADGMMISGLPPNLPPSATPNLEEDDGTDRYTIEGMIEHRRREAREQAWSDQQGGGKDGHGHHRHKKHHHHSHKHGHSHGKRSSGIHPLHRDSQQTPHRTPHQKEPSEESANSGSAITPAPNRHYYEKESAWMDRLAEKNTEAGYDAGFGESGADKRYGQHGSTYGAQAEPFGDQRGVGGRRSPTPGGRYSPTRMMGQLSHSPPRSPPRGSLYGSQAGDMIPGVGGPTGSTSPKPYSTGEHINIDSRFAHGGMTPEQYDAYRKAQERTKQSGGTVANPRLAGMGMGPTPSAEDALHFGAGGMGAGMEDSVLDPAGLPKPYHQHRGHGRSSADGDRSSVTSSNVPSEVPSEVAHAGMTPEQLDAYRKAQERTRAANASFDGSDGGGQFANPRLAALSEQGDGSAEVRSRLKEDHPMKQSRVTPVWESRRDGMMTADVSHAPSSVAAAGSGDDDDVAQEQVDAYEKAQARAQVGASAVANPRLAAMSASSGGGGAVAREQVDAYEKARAAAQVGAAAVANPRLAAASAGGAMAQEQVDAYEKAQARARVGAAAVANPRLAAASASAGGAVAQEQIDAYAKAQARGGVRSNLVAQEQVDAYAKAQARGEEVPATPGAHAASGGPAPGTHPLERTHFREQQGPHPGMAQPHDIPLDAAGDAHRSSPIPQAPYGQTADADSEYDVPRTREDVDEKLMISHLIQNGFTGGLASALVTKCASCPLRVWLVDNSGSMLGTDGHRVVQDARTQSRVNAVDCTRWEEVSSTVTWHAQMCAVLKAPVVFRMLNDPGRPFPQQMSVAERSAQQRDRQSQAGNDEAAEQQLLAGEVHLVRETFRRTRPSGGSNLSRHLRAIYDSVSGMAADLRRDRQRVAVVVVTDGLPSDDYGTESDDASDEFVDVLRKFAGLPVWIVIRLSTDEERVIRYYNGIDNYFTQLGPDLTVDVLDDFCGEAREVHGCNPWLNYALPLHLCRESGMRFSVFDAVDERPLSPGEVRDMCGILFGRGQPGPQGQNSPPFPDPEANWTAFVRELRTAVEYEREQWDPIGERVAPWIDFRELDRIYGGGGGGAAAAQGADGNYSLGTGSAGTAARRGSPVPGGGAARGAGAGAKTGGTKQGCACVIQ